jgi:hypothetical protein
VVKREKERPVSPDTGRRRTGNGVALVAALLAGPFAALGVAVAAGTRPGLPLVPGALAALVGFVLIGEVHVGRSPVRVSGSRLTARTLTGVRTVDLSAVERVRLLTSFAGGGVSDRVLLVRDRDGVCLGLRDAVDRRRLCRALERHASHGPRPRVSRAARAHLGMDADGLGPHTVLSWLATVLGLCGYLSVVAVLAERVPG